MVRRSAIPKASSFIDVGKQVHDRPVEQDAKRRLDDKESVSGSRVLPAARNAGDGGRGTHLATELAGKFPRRWFPGVH